MVETTIRFRTANKTDVAQAYNIRLETLKKWLTPIDKELGDYLGRAYTPKQISMIVEHLGEPENIHIISAKKV